MRVSRPRAEGIEYTVKIFSFLRELETRPMTPKKLKNPRLKLFNFVLLQVPARIGFFNILHDKNA